MVGGYLPHRRKHRRAAGTPTSSGVLLCNFDQNLLDAKGHTLTAGGSGPTLVSMPHGSFSKACYFDAAGGPYFYAADSDDWYFSTGKYTVELWVYFESLPTNGFIIGQFNNSTTDNNFAILTRSTTNLQVAHGMGSSLIVLTATNVLTLFTWHHIALCVDSTTAAGQPKVKLFFNGTQVGSSTTTPTPTHDSVNPLYIGKAQFASQFFNGYMNGLRIQKGVAAYWSDFTPVEAPWP